MRKCHCAEKHLYVSLFLPSFHEPFALSSQTTVLIDGHTVKKLNNYSVTAESYVYTPNYYEESPSPKKKSGERSFKKIKRRGPR